jgi:hypothetical protein
MFPVLIGLGIGALLLLTPKPKQAGAAALPASARVPAVGPTSVTVTLPPATVLPETTITALPADTSMLLTVDEQATLMSNDADKIYDAASKSSHEAFVAYAGLVLAGKGDPRAQALATSVKNWNVVVGTGGQG